jgi:hypothetical protein
MRPVNVKEIEHYQLAVLQLQILPGTVGLLGRLYPEGRVYFRGVRILSDNRNVRQVELFELAQPLECRGYGRACAKRCMHMAAIPRGLAVITIG